jgi:vitamin B12 transporter
MTAIARRLFPLLLAASGVNAQVPDSVPLPRVVITATRVDTPLGAGLVASSVIDHAALQRSGVRDVADALRLLPGVSVARSGGPGSQTSVFLRGGENDYVQVLVDGVPVNDPGGAVDLAWLSVDDLERIEVVRGPASVLYGTDAVSGVVQLFTRRAAGAPRAELTLGAGRYGTVAASGAVAVDGARGGIRVGAARERTDGILAFNNQYERVTASLSGYGRPRPGTRATLAVRGYDDEFHYPTDGAGNLDDRNAFRDGRRVLLSAGVEQDLGSRVKAVASFGAMNARGIDDDRADSPSDTLGFHHYEARTTIRRRVADVRLHVSLTEASVLTVGAEHTREAHRGQDSSNFSFERSAFTADRTTRAAYAQWLSEVGPLAFSAGGRYDDSDVYGSFRTARGSAALRVWQGGRVRASLSTGFKAPTFFETFNTAFSTGNPDLVPEHTRSREVAVVQSLAEGRLTMEATWFHQRFRDLIQYAFVSADLPNYFNVAAAFARGMELELLARPADRVRVGLAGTFLTTRVEDEGLQSGDDATFVRGKRLLRRPSSTIAGTVALDLAARTTADLVVRRTGSRDDRDFATFPATPVTLPAYTRVDLGVTGPLSAAPGLTELAFFLRLENALDARYEEIANYPAARRALSVGIRAAVR